MSDWSEVRSALAGSRQRALDAMRCAGETQSRLLAGILDENRECAFGRAHCFSEIHDQDEFRQAVPLGVYESFAPYIDSMAAGNPSQLTCDAPVAFERT